MTTRPGKATLLGTAMLVAVLALPACGSDGGDGTSSSGESGSGESGSGESGSGESGSKQSTEVVIPAEDFNVGEVSGVSGEPCSLSLAGGTSSCSPGTADGVYGPWDITCNIGLGRAGWDADIDEVVASWEGYTDAVIPDVEGPWENGYFFPQSYTVNAWRGNVACWVEAVTDSAVFEDYQPQNVEEAQTLIAEALAVVFDALPDSVDEREEPAGGSAVPELHSS